MHHSLEKAKRLVRDIRYSGDRNLSLSIEQDNEQYHLTNIFYSNDLAITPNMTPGLHESLSSVLQRLCVPFENVSAFVYAAPDINACCFLGSNKNCVIRFSSALVDILSKEEFEFVIGHEIGHFLSEHRYLSRDDQNNNIEAAIQYRAQEITADRLGLIACNSLSVAIKALIKTASGLNDRHLKFDIASFISQLYELSDDISTDTAATHPNILIRCRALLWFSLNDSYLSKTSYVKCDLSEMDNKISKDMDRYVDRTSRLIISNAKFDLSMWNAAHEIVKKGVFSKEEQLRFERAFGRSSLESLINFMNGLSKSELHNEVMARVKKSREELEKLIPIDFENAVKDTNWD